MTRRRNHRLTLRLSHAAYESLHHAAEVYGESAPARFKRLLAWALCDRLRQEAAEWERVDAHVPEVPWPSIQPVASARAPERQDAFRLAVRLRAAQSVLEDVSRLHFDSEMEGTPEDARLYRLAAQSAGRIAWIVDPLERAVAEVEP